MIKNGFYVTHYLPGPSPENSSLKEVRFLTSHEENISKDVKFYLEFNTGISFSKKSLDLKLELGALVELPSPLHRIRKSQRTWMDKDRNIYIANCQNPLGKKKTKIN